MAVSTAKRRNRKSAATQDKPHSPRPYKSVVVDRRLSGEDGKPVLAIIDSKRRRVTFDDQSNEKFRGMVMGYVQRHPDEEGEFTGQLGDLIAGSGKRVKWPGAVLTAWFGFMEEDTIAREGYLVVERDNHKIPIAFVELDKMAVPDGLDGYEQHQMSELQAFQAAISIAKNPDLAAKTDGVDDLRDIGRPDSDPYEMPSWLDEYTFTPMFSGDHRRKRLSLFSEYRFRDMMRTFLGASHDDGEEVKVVTSKGEKVLRI